MSSSKARSIPLFSCSVPTRRPIRGRVTDTRIRAMASSTSTSSTCPPVRARYRSISAILAATRSARSAILSEHTETFSRRFAMCYPPGARPPDVPLDLLPPMTGGAGGEEAMLTSADGTKLRAYLAGASTGDTGVVIAPDVRGLHRFYEELAERFASAGVHAMAFDYFGRTAGTDRKPDDFANQEHVTAARARPDLIQADVAATAAALRARTGASRIFV